MNLTLKRFEFNEKSTIGKLSVDGVFQCYILEDKTRYDEKGNFVKVPHQTAIPYGTYQIAITFSNRFQKLLPELLNVPQYAGVRIHPGNKPEDTEGCLLPGTSHEKDFVSESRIAFTALFAKMQKAAKKEKLFITIEKAA